MPRLGVLGWPVGHSLSPVMHAAALAQLGLHDWTYQLLPVPPILFEETTRALRTAGFVGANVTVPHKEAALEIADDTSESVREIGAANTLSFRSDGTIRAQNTDAPALLACLPVPAGGLRALVLGAGGSARAAIWALKQAGAAEVMVWNRTPDRARQVAGELGARQVDCPVPADLLVNCTSVGGANVERSFKELALTADLLGEYANVVDLVYRDGPTALLQVARRQGARVVDGLEILVRQGALSLETWTGREPSVDAMRAAIAPGPTPA